MWARYLRSEGLEGNPVCCVSWIAPDIAVTHYLPRPRDEPIRILVPTEISVTQHLNARVGFGPPTFKVAYTHPDLPHPTAARTA